MSSKHFLNNRGDTLIEVLIAITIVTVILGGAYASASRSINTTLASKERDMALQLAQTQIERVRAYRARTTNNTFTSLNNFCMDTNGSPSSNVSFVPTVATDILTGVGAGLPYTPSCVFDSNGAVYVAATASSSPYSVNIELAGGVNFTVHVRWERVGGGENQEIILRYRQY